MEENQKKPIYKKWWFWIIIIVILCIISLCIPEEWLEEEAEENIEENDIEEFIEEDTVDINDTIEEETTTENTKSETTDLNEKEDNLKTILDTIYIYGYKLPLFDGGFEHINTTDTFSVYGGKIVITNAYGVTSDHSYTVRYDNDNNVEQIVVDGTSVYEK